MSQGFASVNRRPLLVLVPILLNLYLWFGAQLSFAPLVERASGFMSRIEASTTRPNEMTIPTSEILSRLGEVDMRQQLAVLNYMPTLLLNVVATAGDEGEGMPMVQSLPQPIDPKRTDTIEVASVGGALLAFILINSIALPLSALFLGYAGAAVRPELPAEQWLRQIPRIVLVILGYAAVITGVALAIGLPFLFITALLLTMNTSLGIFAMSLLFIIWFWVNIYIGFAREAIVISGLGPLRAIYASFNVVRRNFWGTLGFLLIAFVITAGGGVIWQILSGSTPGMILAIIGSSYIGSGLAVARMAFYQDRARQWQATAAPVRPPV